MPIVATRIYRKTEPSREAPIPSKFRRRVKDKTKPIVVDKSAIQKKDELRAVRRHAVRISVYFVNQGVIRSAPR
jgi:hypothetical protein